MSKFIEIKEQFICSYKFNEIATNQIISGKGNEVLHLEIILLSMDNTALPPN